MTVVFDGRDNTPLTLKQIANLMEVMPRIPKRELKCHPLVAEYLRWATLHCVRTPLGNWYGLNACPVYTDPAMEPGAWEIYEDDELKASGNTERPEPHER